MLLFTFTTVELDIEICGMDFIYCTGCGMASLMIKVGIHIGELHSKNCILGIKNTANEDSSGVKNSNKHARLNRQCESM